AARVNALRAGRDGHVNANSGDFAVGDYDRSVLDRRSAYRVHLAAGYCDRLRCRYFSDRRLHYRRADQLKKNSVWDHRLIPVERYEAELEISTPLFGRVEPIIEQSPVYPNPLGFRVNTERIASPQYYVSVFPGFERSNPVVETECPRRVDGEPLDCLFFAHRHSDLGARFHRLCCSLIQPLRAGRIVRVHNRARASVVDQGEIRLHRVDSFHFEAAPVSPQRTGNSFFREKIGDLVRLHAVVEGSNLVSKL